MEKMGREAKLRTTWTSPDAAYEEAVAAFVSAVLSPQTGAAFLSDFVRSCQPLWLAGAVNGRSEEHTSELQSLMRISYAVFCLKKKNNTKHLTLQDNNSKSTTRKQY